MTTSVADTPGSAPLPPGGGPAPTTAMTRRRFVRVAALGTAALAGVAVAGRRLLAGQLDWWQRRLGNLSASYSYAWLPPAERIRRHFDYLTIDPEGLARFVREFERAHGKVTVRKVTANRVLYSSFLMSTDFFRNGADPRRPVRFVAYYDPYRSPCWVPFPPA